MKEVSEEREAADSEPRTFTFLQAAIPFVVTTVAGILLTAVAGLFVYANVPDPKSRDIQFMAIGIVGLGISLVAAWFTARRTIELERNSGNGPALSLLKKYRKAVTHVGADAQAGQYNIGEHYLRDLLGRRGA